VICLILNTSARNEAALAMKVSVGFYYPAQLEFKDEWCAANSDSLQLQ
jgi:hypothetical protein